MKICSRCGEEKPAEAFRYKQGAQCRTCRTELQKLYFQNNPEKLRQYREYQRHWAAENKHRRRRSDTKRRHVFRGQRYGLTPQQFDSLQVVATGRCWICQRTDRRLVIDHRHSDGLVRGIICFVCNQMLGYIGESQDWLARASFYLETPIAPCVIGAVYGPKGKA